MEILGIVSEKGFHGYLRVRALHALKNDLFMFYRKTLHRYKIHFVRDPMLTQHLVLPLSAHCHDLFKQFRNSTSRKICRGKSGDLFQFAFFPLFIQNFFSGADLVFRHLFRQLHSLLI